MKVSAVDPIQRVPIVESETAEERETKTETKAGQSSAGAAGQTETEQGEDAVYWIGSEIVSKTVFDRYDTDKDGVISESEKLAYQKDMGRKSGGAVNLTA